MSRVSAAPPPRIALRPYREEDREAFVSLVTDAALMAHMNGPASLARAHALMDGFLQPEREPRRWDTSQAPNVIDRDAENRSRALGWALDDPGFFARSRVKKLADFATPLSFAVTYPARPFYADTPMAGGLRFALVPLALGSAALALAGFPDARVHPPGLSRIRELADVERPERARGSLIVECAKTESRPDLPGVNAAGA